MILERMNRPRILFIGRASFPSRFIRKWDARYFNLLENLIPRVVITRLRVRRMKRISTQVPKTVVLALGERDSREIYKRDSSYSNVLIVESSRDEFLLKAGRDNKRRGEGDERDRRRRDRGEIARPFLTEHSQSISQ